MAARERAESDSPPARPRACLLSTHPGETNTLGTACRARAKNDPVQQSDSSKRSPKRPTRYPRQWGFSRRRSTCCNPPFFSYLLRTLLHRANSTSFFSSDSELLAQKHPGVGYPFASRTETRTSDAPQEKCLSNSLPVPRECIGRTIGAVDSLRQSIPGPRVPSFPSTFICVGGCDG